MSEIDNATTIETTEVPKKVVKKYRKETKVIKAKVYRVHNSPILINAVIKDGTVRIGSYADRNTGEVVIPISLEEQFILMPDLVGFDPEDRQFKKAVKNYFAELTLTITDTDFVTLNATHTKFYNDKNELVNIETENISDYLMYHQVITHPRVCADTKKAPLKFQTNVIAEVIHEDKQAEKFQRTLELKSIAYSALNKFIADFKHNSYLTEYVIREISKKGAIKSECKILNVNATGEEILNALQHDCEAYPEIVGEILNQDHIDLISLIAFAIKSNIIYDVQGAFYFNDILVGNNEQEILAFMLTPENSGLLSQVKTKAELQ